MIQFLVLDFQKIPNNGQLNSYYAIGKEVCQSSKALINGILKKAR